MAIFYFPCPFCQKEIKAEKEWIGQSAECPYCKKQVVIKQKQAFIPQNELINCKLCNNAISSKIAACPNCGCVPDFCKKLKKFYLIGFALILFGFAMHLIGTKVSQSTAADLKFTLRQAELDYELKATEEDYEKKREEIIKAWANLKSYLIYSKYKKNQGYKAESKEAKIIEVKKLYNKIKPYGIDQLADWSFSLPYVKLHYNAEEKLKAILNSVDGAKKIMETEKETASRNAKNIMEFCDFLLNVKWFFLTVGFLLCGIYHVVSFWNHWMRL